MEFFQDTNIDFMSNRKYFVPVSLALLVISILVVFVQGNLNLGVDFAGGTQLTVKFRAKPQIDDLREAVANAGVGDVQIQRFGADDANEVIIKTPTIAGQEEGSRSLIVEALKRLDQSEGNGSFDLNRRRRDALSELLLELDADKLRENDFEVARDHYDKVAQAISDRRKEEGLLVSWEEVAGISEVSPEVLAALQERAYLGEFAVLGVESVGPQIGAELRKKGILAMVFSLVGMLAYIWFRFELRFGVGALVALIHDVLIVLGLFALAGFEFNLTTIAGFLALVGYSVNDSVVVFDRVRENLRISRRRPLIETMNISLNQTLSRTVLTSGTTLLAVGSLLFLGGDVLRGFAFILAVGVVVGTYSSIFVASPFTLLWEELFGRDARSRRQTRQTA